VAVAVYRREPSPVDYARAAWRFRVSLVVVALLSGASFYGLSFLIPPTYRASASLIPVGDSNPLAALGGLGILGAGLEGLSLRGGQGAADPAMYSDIVQSRRVLVPLLGMSFSKDGQGRPVPLIALLEPAGTGEERVQKAIKRLRRLVSVDLDRRTGLLRIQARAGESVVAAGMANALCELLQRYLLQSLTTQAGENRKFIDGRIAETQADLERAERDLQTFRERNVRIGNAPRLELEEGRLQRAVRQQEEVFLTLQRQRELAQLEEHKDVPILSVLDNAVPPVRRDWPKRGLLAMLGALVGCGVTFAWRLVQGGPRSLVPGRNAA